MKSFFSRLHDTQTGHSKSASRDSYKFWIPNVDPDREAAKPPNSVPTTRAHGEKRSSSRAPKPSPLPMPPYDKPTPITVAAGPSTEHATYPTGRTNPAIPATQYPQLYSQAPSKATSTRQRDYDDGKRQPPPRSASRPLYSTRAYQPPEIPVKGTRHGNVRGETATAVPHEAWLPTNPPATSKQGEDQWKQQNQEGKEASERYRSRIDEKAVPVEGSKRERERERPKEERDRGKERGGEREKIRHPAKDREQEKATRERERDRERQRTHDQDREREREREREEREKEREGEREKEKQREKEREERELAREAEREQQRIKEREREAEQREKDREREQEREQREKEHQREQERQQREKEREREQERQQREKEREREKEKEKERERHREQREREREREKERARYHERDRREREKERDREKHRVREREYEREKEREGGEREKGKERTVDVIKGSPNAKGKGRAREEDAAALDSANKMGQPDRAVLDSHNQDRDLRKEKDARTARDLYKWDRDHPKYRAEATDGEQDLRRSKPRTHDRDRRREANAGWVSDNFAGQERKLSRQGINQEPVQVLQPDDGESSDNSTRAKVGPRLLQRRNRIDDVGSSAKLRSGQDRPSENADPANSLAGHPQNKILPVTLDAQPPVPPTPLRMPVHLPPREPRTADRPLQQLSNTETVNEPEAPMRREINRLKLNSRQDDSTQHLPEFHSKPAEPTNFAHRRPPSRVSIIPHLPTTQSIISQTPRIGPTFLPTTTIPQTPRVGPSLLPQSKYVQPPITTASLLPESARDTNQSQPRSDWAKEQRSYVERPFEFPPTKPKLETSPLNQATSPNPQGLDRNPKPIQTTLSVGYNDSQIEPQSLGQEPPPHLHSNASVAVFVTTIDRSAQPFSQLHVAQSKESQGKVTHDEAIKTVLEPLSQAPPVSVSTDIRYPNGRRVSSVAPTTLAVDARADAPFVSEPGGSRLTSQAHHTPLMQPPPIKPVQALESASQAYTGLSIQRPPTTTGYREGSRQDAPNPMPLANLSTDIPEPLPTLSSSEARANPTDTSYTGRPVNYQHPWTGLVQNRIETSNPNSAPNPAEYLSPPPRLAPSDSQSKIPGSNTQERVGMSISRPSTSAGFRQDTAKTLVPSDSHFRALDVNIQERMGMPISRPPIDVGFLQDSNAPSDSQPKAQDWNPQERIGISIARPSTNVGFRQDNTKTLTSSESQPKVPASSGQERIGISIHRPSTNADFRQDGVKPFRHYGPSKSNSDAFPEGFQSSTIIQTSSSSNRVIGHDDGRRTYSSQHMGVQNVIQSVDPRNEEVFPHTGITTTRPTVQKRGNTGLPDQQFEKRISAPLNMPTIVSPRTTNAERESPRACDLAINLGSVQNTGTSTMQVPTPLFSKQDSPRTIQDSERFAIITPQLLVPEHPAHRSMRGSKQESPKIPESQPTVSPSKAMAIPITDEAESAANPDLKLEIPDKQREQRSLGIIAHNHNPGDGFKQEDVHKLRESSRTNSGFVPQMKIYRNLTSIVPQYDPEMPSVQVSGFVSPSVVESIPQQFTLPVTSSNSGWGVPQAIQLTTSSAENLRPQPSPRHKPDESSARRSEPKFSPFDEEKRSRQPVGENQLNSIMKTSVQLGPGFKHGIADTPVDKDAPSLGFFTTTFSSALSASMDKNPAVENPPLNSDAIERTNGESRAGRSYVTSGDSLNKQTATIKTVESQPTLRETLEPRNPRVGENQVNLLRVSQPPIPPSPILRKEFEVNRPLNMPSTPSHPPKISHPILAEILSSPPPKTFANMHAEPLVPITLETNRWAGSSSNDNANLDHPKPRNIHFEREHMNTDTSKPSTSQRYAGDSHPKVALEHVHGLAKIPPPVQDNPGPPSRITIQPVLPIAHGRDPAMAFPPIRVPSSSNQPEREQVNTDTSWPWTGQRYVNDTHAKATLEHVHGPLKDAPPPQDNHTPPLKISDIQPVQIVAHGKDTYVAHPSTAFPPSRVPSASTQPPVAIQPALGKQTAISTADSIRLRHGPVRSGLDPNQMLSPSQDRQANVLYPAPIAQSSTENPGLPPEGYSYQKGPSQAFVNLPSAPLMQNFSTSQKSSHQANRHHHSASLPTSFVPPLTTNHLTTKTDYSRSRSPAHDPTQISPFQTELVRVNPTKEKTTVSLPQAPSEETILMTPSSLAQSTMLKPTVSRQSITPSMTSQTAKKGGGILSMFRKTPIQPPAQQYEIWHPNGTSKTPDSSPGHSKAMHTPPGLQAEPPSPRSRRVNPPADFSMPVPIHGRDERKASHSHVFTPFRYLTTKRNRAVSVASVEAQDGTAPNTIVGSPTASMHSQAPIQPPPLRDPWLATEEWRNKGEADAKVRAKAKLRRRPPGVVFDVDEEHPEASQKRPRRTRTRYRSSGKQTETPQT